MKKVEVNKLETDLLIIGGGTAGCYGALTAGNNPDISVIILEKANIRRSGCLAAGVNAINVYITKGKRPEDYVTYAKKDAENIVREDLLLTMAEGVNKATKMHNTKQIISDFTFEYLVNFILSLIESA